MVNKAALLTTLAGFVCQLNKAVGNAVTSLNFFNLILCLILSVFTNGLQKYKERDAELSTLVY
jgi:hypothetical protein